jgi:alpha-tubulin suppressor-like RCC1 family protein
MADGVVKCWGRNDWGQVGNETTDLIWSPIDVPGIGGAIAIAAGTWHSCAILSNGTVYCWGNNAEGNLGNGGRAGNDTSTARPKLVTGIDGDSVRATAVVASDQNTCIILSDKSIRCFGGNEYGQLGNGNTLTSTTPVLAQTGLTASALALGRDMVCVLNREGKVQCWGRGDKGRLGNGSTQQSFEPVDVALPSAIRVSAIASKYDHSCALTVDGVLWCWGDNSQGQLGTGSTALESSVPVKVIAPDQN